MRPWMRSLEYQTGFAHGLLSGSGLMWAIFAVLLLALTACTPAPPAVVTPPLPAYTCAEQRQAADELDMLPRDAVLERMAEDYATLRAQVRALRNEPEPEGCE